MILIEIVYSLGDEDSIANSLDPYQSSLIWVCTVVCQRKSIQKLSVITNVYKPLDLSIRHALIQIGKSEQGFICVVSDFDGI